ncbi:MAG: PIG-L family deacetylase [Deltaproteobacteria bacterium]|nr:PIG-L family deacetylase [Deltaproteobacteria bacterium]
MRKPLGQEKHLNTILVVAAHPDDEVLGCGGTIARLAREGHDVHILILGEGITSRYDSLAFREKEQVADLRARSQKAIQLLGAKDVFYFDYPDNRFDTIPLLEIVKTLEKKIQEIRPAIVFTQHGGDLNIDHAVTFRSVLTATRPMSGHSVKELCAFEVPSSTEWAFGRFTPTFRPNVFLDISETIDVKIQAMAVYESEVRAFPHPRSPEALESIAQKWGSTVGLPAAEAFEAIRLIR